jgi:hypothetical protein
MLPEGKGGRCVGLTTLPPSCADCLEILAASSFWIAMGLSSSVQGHLYLYNYHRKSIFSEADSAFR